VRLAEREERDWTYFGRLRHQREKKLRDPQDMLIEADRLRQRSKRRRAVTQKIATIFRHPWVLRHREPMVVFWTQHK